MLKPWTLAALFLISTATAQAQDSPWLLRGRFVQPDFAYDPNPGGFSVEQRWMPEVDASYFFSKNWAAEFSFTALKNQNVFSSGLAIGNFSKLPPTLMAQYHADRWSGFKPYVGVGITYTKSATITFTNPAIPTILMNNHVWGPALQMGVDVPLDERWSLNWDIKRSNFRSDITTAGSTVDTKINLRVVGVGVGYRF